jgi:hypothetical protein
MTSYDYFTEVGAEELENQNEEEACCLEVRALFAAQRGLKSNKKACSEANAAMNAAIGKISRLQRENRKLKDELERLKEAQPEEAQPEDEPQCLDADGVPIEVGDTVYYFDKKSGEPKAGFGPFRVIDYGPHAQAVLLRYEKGGVDGYGNYSESFESCELLTHREPDSWEKLEEDALKTSCAYFGKLEEPNAFCTECPHGGEITGRGCIKNMRLDIVRRAKRLAGVEEQEGE